MRAKMAGYMYHSPACVLPHMEKAAPIMGPKRKPRLNATPIRAMPFPLLAGVETSVTIAVDRLTFPASIAHAHTDLILLHPPLDMPPIILATTKIAKLPENTQSRYEIEMPITEGNVVLSPLVQRLTYSCDNHERLPPKPVAESSNHRTGQELQEGEERAKEPSKQHRVELGWSTNYHAEDIHLLLQHLEQPAVVLLPVVGDQGGEERQDEGEGCYAEYVRL